MQVHLDKQVLDFELEELEQAAFMVVAEDEHDMQENGSKEEEEEDKEEEDGQDEEDMEGTVNRDEQEEKLGEDDEGSEEGQKCVSERKSHNGDLQNIVLGCLSEHDELDSSIEKCKNSKSSPFVNCFDEMHQEEGSTDKSSDGADKQDVGGTIPAITINHASRKKVLIEELSSEVSDDFNESIVCGPSEPHTHEETNGHSHACTSSRKDLKFSIDREVKCCIKLMDKFP